MKYLKCSSIIGFTIALIISQVSFASTETTEAISSALRVIRIEKDAINSGRYRAYKPETMRNIISQIKQSAAQAYDSASTETAQASLHFLLRSLNREIRYSYNFQNYRLESARLLLLDWEAFLKIANETEDGRSVNRSALRSLAPLDQD